MEYKDYYKTLGVPRTATPAEIKKAYRRLARELHPDRHPDDKTAERRFKEVNEAQEVLTDPAKRQQYDLLGANWDQHARGAGGATGNPFGGDPFGAGGPFADYAAQPGQADNVRYEFRGGGGEDFSDFFRTFFGGAAPGTAGSAGSGQRATERPPVATSTRGRTSRRGGLDDLLSKLRFDGAGNDGQPDEGQADGRRGRNGDIEVEVDLSLEEAFNGSARLVQIGAKRLEVKVPRGVETGSKIRLSGKAGSGSKAGDVYLITKIRPHPAFSRTGADLTREVPITLQEALLGGEVDVETLGGRVILTLPAGTQQGQTFRLTGKGMPRLKGETAGDLFAKVKIVMPPKLEGKQKQAAQEFLSLVIQPNPRRTQTP
jgi:curved DNA-binding protein